MSRGVYKRRENQNIYVNDKKICANPRCWEEILESQVYCSTECGYVCKILKRNARKKNKLFKYQKEYNIGIPKKRHVSKYSPE